MVDEDRKCSRCGGETVAGGIRDTRGLSDRAVTATWLPPGHKAGFMPYAVPGELPIVAARCVSCGHLDLFAKG